MEAAFDAVGVVAALAVALAVVRGATPVRAAVAAVALAVVVGFTGAVVGTATMLLGIGAALIASARAGGGEPGGAGRWILGAAIGGAALAAFVLRVDPIGNLRVGGPDDPVALVGRLWSEHAELLLLAALLAVGLRGVARSDRAGGMA